MRPRLGLRIGDHSGRLRSYGLTRTGFVTGRVTSVLREYFTVANKKNLPFGHTPSINFSSESLAWECDSVWVGIDSIIRTSVCPLQQLPSLAPTFSTIHSYLLEVSLLCVFPELWSRTWSSVTIRTSFILCTWSVELKKTPNYIFVILNKSVIKKIKTFGGWVC